MKPAFFSARQTLSTSTFERRVTASFGVERSGLFQPSARGITCRAQAHGAVGAGFPGAQRTRSCQASPGCAAVDSCRISRRSAALDRCDGIGSFQSQECSGSKHCSRCRDYLGACDWNFRGAWRFICARPASLARTKIPGQRVMSPASGCCLARVRRSDLAMELNFQSGSGQIRWGFSIGSQRSRSLQVLFVYCLSAIAWSKQLRS